MNEQYFTSLNGYYVKDKEAIHTYNSVDEMKADSKIREGSYVKTRGYYNPNDGGNGDYIIRTKTNDDVEDNGSIHFTQNNLVAELIINEGLNVLQFGLKADGVYDNTDLFINVVKKGITDKIDIYFPSGIYNGNFEIDLTELYNSVPTYAQSKININIKGDGRSSVLTSNSESILALRGCATDENGNQTTQRTLKWLTISNLKIDGLSRENDNIGIELNTCQNINLYDIEIFNCRQALVGYGAMDISVSLCDFMDSGYIDENNNVYYSLLFDNSSLTPITTNAVKISNCRIETTPALLRARGRAYSIHIVNTKFEMGRTNEVASYRPIYIEEAKNVIFTNCHFQYSNGYTSADIMTRLSDNYFIRVNGYPNYTKNSGNRVLFNACDFCTNPNYKALWFDGYNTNFSNCIFAGVDAIQTSRPFDLRGLCTFTNNTFFLIDGQSVFTIRGNNNVIKNLRLILDGELTNNSGEIVYLANGATNNYIECDRGIENISNNVPFVSGHSSFQDSDGLFNYGSNVVKANDIKNLQSNNIVVSLRGNDFVLYDGTNFNKVNHIHEGQTVKFLFLNNVEVNVTGNIRTNTGLLKNFNANSVVEFLVHNGILYEID